MSLQTLKDQKGFTIVELLIVIVVIGILAAITIVAYNGIQNRAKDTKYKGTADTIIKKIEGVNADTGNYPTGTAQLTGDIGALPAGVGVTTVTAAPTDNDALKTAANATPSMFSVWYCTTGANVYIPSATSSTITVKQAGQGCS